MWLFTENVNVIIQRNIGEGIYLNMCNYKFYSYFYNFTYQINYVKRSHLFLKKLFQEYNQNMCFYFHCNYDIYHYLKF